jgi:predicted dehydrogenase
MALRVGVIGTGCIGIEHINNLHLVDDVVITAIADSHEPSRRSALATLSALGLDDTAVAVHEGYQSLLASPSPWHPPTRGETRICV